MNLYYSKETRLENYTYQIDFYNKITSKLAFTKYRYAYRDEKGKKKCVQCDTLYDLNRRKKEINKQLDYYFSERELKLDYMQFYDLPYPENLLDLLGIIPEKFDNYYDYILPKFDENIKQIFPILTNIEIDILVMRYKDNLTYEKISEKYNVTRQCIRQKLSRIIRKIKSKINFITIGCSPYLEKIEFEVEQLKKNMTYEIAKKIVEENEMPPTALSTRLKNFLKANNYNCVSDIASNFVISKMLGTKNFGLKSLKELNSFMESYGYAIVDDRYVKKGGI